jgi:hypothetical protein
MKGLRIVGYMIRYPFWIVLLGIGALLGVIVLFPIMICIDWYCFAKAKVEGTDFESIFD